MRRIGSLAAACLLGFGLVGCTHRVHSYDPCAPACDPDPCYEPGLLDDCCLKKGSCLHGLGRGRCRQCAPAYGYPAQCPPASCPPAQCPPTHCPPAVCPQPGCGPAMMDGGFTPVPQACGCGHHHAGAHGQPYVYEHGGEFTGTEYAMTPETFPSYPTGGGMMPPGGHYCPHCQHQHQHQHQHQYTQPHQYPQQQQPHEHQYQGGLPPAAPPATELHQSIPGPGPAVDESTPMPMPAPVPEPDGSVSTVPPASFWSPTAPARYTNRPVQTSTHVQTGAVEAF